MYDSPRHRAASADARLSLTSDVVLSAEATTSSVKYAEATPGPSFGTAHQISNSFKVGINANTGIGLLNVSAYRNSLDYPDQVTAQLGLPPGSPMGPSPPGNSAGPGGSAPPVGGPGPVSSSITVNSATSNILSVVQASDLFKLGAQHTARLGLEYRDNVANAGGGIGKIGEQVYAGSAMWSWQIAPTWALTNSVRFDHMILEVPPVTTNSASGVQIIHFPNVTISEPSFNSGLVYDATANDTIRITAARGSQTPSLLDFGLQPPGSATRETAPKPATIVNYEFNYERRIRKWSASWSSSLFYQQTDNLVANLTSAAPLPQAGATVATPSGLNLGESSAIGGETILKGTTPSGLRWNVSYAHISITQSANANAAGASSQPIDFSHGSPSDVLIGGIGFTWAKVELDAQGRWQSSFMDSLPSTLGTSTPWLVHSYATLNARLGYRLTNRLVVALSSQQFNHARQFQSAGPAIERRVLLARDHGSGCAPRPGRSSPLSRER